MSTSKTKLFRPVKPRSHPSVSEEEDEEEEEGKKEHDEEEDKEEDEEECEEEDDEELRLATTQRVDRPCRWSPALRCTGPKRASHQQLLFLDNFLFSFFLFLFFFLFFFIFFLIFFFLQGDGLRRLHRRATIPRVMTRQKSWCSIYPLIRRRSSCCRVGSPSRP